MGADRGSPVVAAVATVFLAAFLLFLLQPIVARMLLPRFGGTTAVWTTCMLFFQAALLAGYAWASALATRIRPGTQRGFQLALATVALLTLPFAPAGGAPAGGESSPALRLLLLLLGSIGLPFAALAATSPLVQAWLATGGTVPWHLYAFSNAGSLLALLAYPVLIEPWLTTRTQVLGWSAGFGLFVVLTGWVALRTSTTTDPAAEARAEDGGTGPMPWLLWLALAACASVLLLAVTNELTLNVAPVPFLWVLPLALYLLTFILCFHDDRWYRRRLWLRALAVAAIAMTWVMSLEAPLDLRLEIAIYSAGLFVCCMVCHGELVRLRPGAARLTVFYLVLATGGALGGVFVGLVAPAIFPDTLELPLGLGSCVLLAFLASARDPAGPLWEIAPCPRRIAIAGLIAVVALAVGSQATRTVRDAHVATRNFYGTLKIRDETVPGGGTRRVLIHGATSHGLQFLDEARRNRPSGYYGHRTGVGAALAVGLPAGPARVGLIGLGAGALAAYGRPGDRYRFYEINPSIVEHARTSFTFLSDSLASIDVVIDDARQALEREAPNHFDVLVADAFSSDAVPAHLLTVEAFELYFRHLRRDGLLAVHASNRYLDLASLVSRTLASLGRRPIVVYTPADPLAGDYPSEWVITSLDDSLLQEIGRRAGVEAENHPSDGIRPWTDEYGNLFRILR